MSMEQITTDVLVIGGVGSAIRTAIKASRSGVKTDLVNKGKVGESGSSPRSLVGFSVRCNVEDSNDLFF